jgi:hypothetical protein
LRHGGTRLERSGGRWSRGGGSAGGWRRRAGFGRAVERESTGELSEALRSGRQSAERRLQTTDTRQGRKSWLDVSLGWPGLPPNLAKSRGAFLTTKHAHSTTTAPGCDAVGDCDCDRRQSKLLIDGGPCTVSREDGVQASRSRVGSLVVAGHDCSIHHRTRCTPIGMDTGWMDTGMDTDMDIGSPQALALGRWVGGLHAQPASSLHEPGCGPGDVQSTRSQDDDAVHCA